MKISPIRLAAVALLVTGLSAASAVAATSDTNVKELKKTAQQAKTACAKDIEKLCSDVTAGGGRILDCLSSKSDQLSSNCASKRTELKANVSKAIDKAEVAFRRECGTDVQKYCQEIPSGQGRLLDCLSQHDENLSTSCHNFQAKISQKIDEVWSM